MAGQAGSDAEKRLASAYQAVLFIAGMSIVIGLIAVLFDVRFLKQFGHGFASLLSGSVFLILAHFVKRQSMAALGIAIILYILDGIAFLVFIPKTDVPPFGGIILRIFLAVLMFRGIGAIRELRQSTGIFFHPPNETYTSRGPSPGGDRLRQQQPSFSANTQNPVIPGVSFPSGESSAQMPQAVSFVAPSQSPSAAPQTGSVIPVAEEVPSGTVRFSAYRCEMDAQGIRAVYVNGTQRELEWSRVSSVMVRQLPLNAPWDGKLILDILSLAPGTTMAPIRILSSTFANYSVLPQGQSAASRENIRRLVEYIWERNPSVYLDPETVSFVKGGRPPARFANMTQFARYDSRFHS